MVSCTFGVNSTVFFSVFQSSHFLEEWVVLSTAARIHGHSWVDLQNHVSILVQEEDTEGIHLVWNATWFRDPWDDSDSSDDTLDGGMIRWMCQLKKSSVEKKQQLALRTNWTTQNSQNKHLKYFITARGKSRIYLLPQFRNRSTLRLNWPYKKFLSLKCFLLI